MGGMFHPDSRLMRILTTASEFIALNIIYLLCCIPIFTIGPSTAALYTVTRKMAKHEGPIITRAFFQAFRENFKKGFLASLALLVPAVLAVSYALLSSTEVLRERLGWLGTLCWIGVVIIAVVCSYTWPLLAWFENRLGQTLKNAALLPMSNPLIALMVTGLNLLPWLLLLWAEEFMIRASFLWLVAGFSLTAFVNTQLLRLQFRRFMPGEFDRPKEEEE